MSNSSNNSSGGVGFLGLLTILFIGLKLTGHIDWGWVWVLAPIWAPMSLLGAVLLVIFVSRLLETDKQRKVRKAQETIDAFARKYGNK